MFIGTRSPAARGVLPAFRRGGDCAFYVVVLPSLWCIMGNIVLWRGCMMEQLFVVGLPKSLSGIIGIPYGITCAFLSLFVGFVIPMLLRAIFGYSKSNILKPLLWLSYYFCAIYCVGLLGIPFADNQWAFLRLSYFVFPLGAFFRPENKLFTDKYRRKIINYLFHRQV